jgi:hypothetical protein
MWLAKSQYVEPPLTVRATPAITAGLVPLDAVTTL